MTISGPLTLLVALAGIAIVLLVAFRTRFLDALAHRLEGPPQRHQQRARSHCRVVGAPSPLPRRDQGDCGLYDYDGGDAA